MTDSRDYLQRTLDLMAQVRIKAYEEGYEAGYEQAKEEVEAEVWDVRHQTETEF